MIICPGFEFALCQVGKMAEIKTRRIEPVVVIIVILNQLNHSHDQI